MKLILKIFRLLLRIVYAPMKLLPADSGKILFLSRQSNEITLDFAMLQSELAKRDPELRFITICKRSSDSRADYLSFGICMLRSMYHLATSKICIIDSYWPAVCMLNHKNSLTVIQIWHALGKIKQSGYQTVGRAGGRDRVIADELCMHRNYDYIIAGGKAWNPYYCASFGTTEDRLVNIGLPRIDYLLNQETANREKIYKAYPEFRDKTVLLYAPTFRKGIEANWLPLAENMDFDRYILVVKGHPNQPLTCDIPEVCTCDEFKSAELLSVCDYLITDYSAIAIEGAILNRKTFYFVYDYEEYTSKNGTNIDLFKEMPGCVFRSAKELCHAIDGEYPEDSLKSYRQRFLPEPLGCSTRLLADMILTLKGN